MKHFTKTNHIAPQTEAGDFPSLTDPGQNDVWQKNRTLLPEFGKSFDQYFNQYDAVTFIWDLDTLVAISTMIQAVFTKPHFD